MNKTLQQDLNNKQQDPGTICPIHLFFKEKASMPEKVYMTEVMAKHLGEVDCFTYDDKTAGFAAKDYIAKFKGGSMPVSLMITECIDVKDFVIDDLTKSQFWDCPESETILSECKYHVIAVDMMSGAIENYKDHANLMMNYMEALVEMFPDCEAVLFQNSGKMMTRDKIVNHKIPHDDRFIYFAVNVRFFNIQGSDDMVVDSVGMSTLYLPDVQYHFHGMDPNWVVNHAYNVLSYIYQNDAIINSGETIDGITDGEMDQSIQWKCQYEESLIQPIRHIMDINMAEYAAGQRK